MTAKEILEVLEKVLALDKREEKQKRKESERDYYYHVLKQKLMMLRWEEQKN